MRWIPYQKFLKYLKDNGIVSQWTPLEIPQLNGISEKRNRILLNMVRSMMSFTNLSLYLRGHTLLTAIHLLNRIPSKSISITPYEIWYGKKLNLDYLKTWECSTYVKRQMTDKLEDRSVIAHFHGILLLLSTRSQYDYESKRHIPRKIVYPGWW